MQQKRIGKNGGFTIPKSLRVALDMPAGSAVDVEQVDGGVLLRPHVELCRICGTAEQVVILGGKGICRACAQKALEG